MTSDSDEHYSLGESWYNSENSKQWGPATSRMIIMTEIATVDRIAIAAMVKMTGTISTKPDTIQ